MLKPHPPTWYRIECSPTDLLAIENTFVRFWADFGYPADAALFARREPTDPTYVYVSPGADTFFAGELAVWSAQPCPPPSPSAVSLLAGHNDACNMLVTKSPQ